jgi:hypothetical protein
MLLKSAAAGLALAVAAAGVTVSGRQTAPVTIDSRPASAADLARIERAVTVSSARYDEWLGASRAAVPQLQLTRAAWSSADSMDLESQVAFLLARARFGAIAETPATLAFRDSIAWHLQARVVEELFDLAHHQPGHHADGVRMFGGHVRWGVPILVLPATARDERAPTGVRRAARVIATLEQVVGWPALAASLRILATQEAPPLDRAGVSAVLEPALGVPLDWVFDAIEPASRINYRLGSVDTSRADCGGEDCYRTAVTVVREGRSLFPDPARPFSEQIAIRIDFSGESSSTLWWSGTDASRTFTVDSGLAPVAVTLDPDRVVAVDAAPLDQRWRADRTGYPRPIKSLASWLVWLQHAALTYGALF